MSAWHCRLYMDGDLAGEVAQGGPNTNLNGMLPMSGGKPMAVPQTITLCSRFDNNPSRHYDGLLAYLSKALVSCTLLAKSQSAC